MTLILLLLVMLTLLLRKVTFRILPNQQLNQSNESDSTQSINSLFKLINPLIRFDPKSKSALLLLLLDVD
jgi:hypothetical protein